jgi:MoxR-like ATPase
MMKVLVDYPTEDEEFVIVQRVIGEPAHVTGVVTPEQLMALQAQCRRGYVDPGLVHYAVKLVAATRQPERYGLEDIKRFLSFGASPRATIGLIEGARALAFLRGRDYALPEDVADLVPDVLRHRLVLSYEALSEGQTPDSLIARIMQAVPVPDKPLESHARMAASA